MLLLRDAALTRRSSRNSKYFGLTRENQEKFPEKFQQELESSLLIINAGYETFEEKNKRTMRRYDFTSWWAKRQNLISKETKEARKHGKGKSRFFLDGFDL